MQMTELIAKKRDGGALTTEEIGFMIDGYVRGEIPDYQMSAMCMAILFSGMDDREILDLTMSMMHSGETLDLSPIRGVKADKHSTGGVGDKTSLVLCPMVAACGVKIAKMSGRGLGHTGGTIDKLESFPGFVTGIPEERFFENVNRIGIAIAGQTAEVCPADKKLYALRDVTGTVPSIPLIVSSIMSKKLAAGADVIVLDVKCGSGAFMKTPEQARELAEGLTRVGKLAGRKCAAVITDMDEPLGYAVGNALEVREAIDVLAGRTAAGELKSLCLTLGANMLTLSGLAADETEARAKLEATIADGSALRKLAEMVEAQGGDSRAVYDFSLLPDAAFKREVPSQEGGYIAHIEADDVGLVSMHLGGGRVTKESAIDLSVGVVLHKKVGDRVEPGESLATIHASSEEKAARAEELLRACYTLSPYPVEKAPFIKNIVK
ncbi:MAG: pyrimidine-nucleoside phosphorylase [Oscillospiraceae bacterium]|nr:pyrimidine-nucleoside phosphorylase [Oscillospiraceae bacterium]